MLSLLSDTYLLIKILYVFFAFFYFIFSLVIIRQVKLMSETVRTEGGPILQALAIFHAVLALGVVILLISLA